MQHIAYDHAGKVMSGGAPGFQVIRGVHEHLVDGIDMNILRGHISGIDVIYSGAVINIKRHTGLGHNIVQLQMRVTGQLTGQAGAAGEVPAPEPATAAGILRFHLLHHLKQPGPAGNTVGLQRRGDRQADGLFRAAAVSHHKAGVQRVQPPLYTLHRGIEGLQVNGDIGSVPHGFSVLSNFWLYYILLRQ